MSTSVTSVTSHFPSAQNGFTTTLASTISSGAATVPLNSVAGYTNGQIAVFVVDPTDASKKQTFTGTIDTAGVQVTSVVWTAGTNQTHSAGSTVVDYATATHISMVSKGLLVEHKQAGTHAAVTADSVTVATGKITTGAVGKLEDRSIALDTYRTGFLFDFVVSGGVWTADSAGVNRNGSMTAIVVMVNGQLLNSTNSPGLAAITAHTFTASKDTYVDILNTAGVGTVVYTEATNNAASPALAANSIRIGIIVAGASSIASAASINQGQETMVLPIASSIAYSVTDSLGNLICPRDPNRKVLGYSQIVATTSTTATPTTTDITGLSTAVIVPTGRKVKITVSVARIQSSQAAGNAVRLLARESSTTLAESMFITPVASYSEQLVASCITSPTAGSHTYKASYSQDAAGTLQITFNTPAVAAYLLVELV